VTPSPGPYLSAIKDLAPDVLRLAILAAIAAGLFANAGANLMRPAQAQAPSMTDGYLHSISQAMTDIAGGTCGNITICDK
jgi:hypothetical protein